MKTAISLEPEVFLRNFGLQYQEKYLVEIVHGDLDEFAICMVKDNEGTSVIMCLYRRGNSLYPTFRSIDKLNVLFPDLNAVSISKLPIDATNLHYLIKTKTGQIYHMKEYTRTKKGFVEASVSKALDDAQIVPKLLFSFIIEINEEMHCLASLFEEITPMDNLDAMTGALFDKVLDNGDIDSILQPYLYYLRSAIATIRKFQESINVPGLKNKLRPFAISLRDEFEAKLTRVKKYLQNWYQFHSPFISSLDKWEENFTAFEQQSSARLQEGQFLIHGDIWWRQFVFSEDKVILLDIEDIMVGNPEYDLASLSSGIANQIAYFFVERNANSEIVSQLWDRSMQTIFEELPSFDFSFLIIRMIAELDYAISHWNSDPTLPPRKLQKHVDLVKALYDCNLPIKSVPSLKETIDETRYFLIDFLVLSILSLITKIGN